MKILVHYPSRQRPSKFKKTLWEWWYTAHDKKSISWLISLDEDDPTLEEYKKALGVYPIANLEHKIGISANKIAAINRDIPEYQAPWDILIVVSDDFHPKPDWDKRIRENMSSNYPDLDGCLWYNDGYTEQRICTLPLMGCTYYKRFGYVYFGGYRNVYADNEQTEVAQALGRITYFPEPIATHEHFANNGDVERDELYAKNETSFGRDKLTYVLRKKAGFYLTGCAGAPAKRKKYTQNNEQELIAKYFGESVGTVLDIGCNDGKTLSNSLALIEKGWDAVLIDANEEAFDRLLILHAERMADNNVECLHLAVGPETKMVQFYESGEHLHNGDVGLLSTTSREEASKWEPSGVTFQEKEVQMVTFQELLTRTIHQSFDLISIDIEGLDLEVFQQIDLKAVGCKMALVEVNDRDPQPFVDHAQKHGLRLVHRNGENLVFQR